MIEKKVLWKEALLNVLAVVFFIWGLGAIYGQFLLDSVPSALWFCYYALIFIAVGIFIRNGYLIAAQFVIILVPFLFWNMDFFYQLFSGQELWGLTSYLFNSDRLFYANVISLQHIFTIPLTLLALWLIKIEKFDFWMLASLEVFIVFLVSKAFANELNVNCVDKACLPLESAFPYWIVWFLSFFVMIVLSSLLLQNLKFLRKNAKINDG